MDKAKSKVKITVDGKTYVSVWENISADAFAENIYEKADGIERLKVKLSNGKILVLPIDAVRRAHFVFIPAWF